MMMNKDLLQFIAIAMLLVFAVVNTACVRSPLRVAKKEDPYAPVNPEPIDVRPKYNGAIYQEGMTVGMFDNRTAKRIGDILTIELEESATTGAQSSTSANKENSVEMQSPTIAGETVTNKDGKEVLNNRIDGGRDFSGSGDTSQSHNLTGKISVTVAQVLPNKYLVIRGQKMLNLNQANEFIRISGIVRPEDIRPDNTVLSHRIANAHIMYGDSGTLSSANSMGPLGKFFNSKNYPY
ncbi:MAG: flagellar basal body L-ring protein FlgH [Gammaproteobacteria bacterium]|nr:flagellar basal body L-ring protein FlgH [Gammaproteobacteria bacterium]